MAVEDVRIDTEERERAGGQSRPAPLDHERCVVFRTLVTVGQRRGHVGQAVFRLLGGVQRRQLHQPLGPHGHIVAYIDGDCPLVARSPKHGEPWKLDGRRRPIGQPARWRMHGAKVHLELLADRHSGGHVDANSSGRFGRTVFGRGVAFEWQGISVGGRHAGHLPAGRRGQVERKPFFDPRQQRQPAENLLALVGDNQQQTGGDGHFGRRSFVLGRQRKIAPRRVPGRHRRQRRRVRAALQQCLGQRATQHRRVDRYQSIGGQRFGLQPALDQQAEHGHAADHVQRRQPRRGPVVQRTGRADCRDAEHHGLGRLLAKPHVEHMATGLLLHVPAGQQR